MMMMIYTAAANDMMMIIIIIIIMMMMTLTATAMKYRPTELHHEEANRMVESILAI
jgi:heme/copper-type cytochrome/quinol oxidase subunit 2